MKTMKLVLVLMGALTLLVTGCGATSTTEVDTNGPTGGDGYNGSYDVNNGGQYDGGGEYGGEDQEPGPDDGQGDASDQGVCSDATDAAVTMYMSADDSNSQANPVLLRALVLQDRQDPAMFHIPPREYEFLNYYTFEFDDRPGWGQLSIVPEATFPEDSTELTFLVSVVSPTLEERRPINFVFSLDTSGSMGGGGIERTKYTLTAIAHMLREGDRISIVEWNHTQAIILEDHLVTGPDDPELMSVIRNLSASGSTDLHSGLVTAYELAMRHYDPGVLTRVFLVSDGGANTGVTDASLIGEHAEAEEGEGIYLIGIGASSSNMWYNHHLMDTVTDIGKGAYVYIDSQEEAERVFGEGRFLSNVEVAAIDVRLEVTFPPMFVLDRFHGEEVSTRPEEVREQNMGPNDGMYYHFTVAYCGDASELPLDAEFTFRVTWKDPATREARDATLTATVGELLSSPGTHLWKAELLIRYARVLVNADGLEPAARIEEIGSLVAEMERYVDETGDGEMDEPIEVLNALAAILGNGE